MLYITNKMSPSSSCTVQILLKDTNIEPLFFENYINEIPNINLTEIYSTKLCDAQCIIIKLIGDFNTDYNELIDKIIEHDNECYKIIEDQHVKIMGMTF